jgi:DNA-binding XRE family transcriptional regulator
MGNFIFNGCMAKPKMFSETDLAALARELREKSGKRKIDLARELGLGKATIQKAEEYPQMSLTKVRRRIIEACSSFEVFGPVFILKRRRTSRR